MAPIKPTIIEIMHPPRLKPDNERAIEPAIPAIISDIRMFIILSEYFLNNYKCKLNFVRFRINLESSPIDNFKFTKINSGMY